MLQQAWLPLFAGSTPFAEILIDIFPFWKVPRQLLESKAELDAENAVIDIENVKFLYSEAKFLIPAIQKTFEETLFFHSQMILEKNISFKNCPN